MLNSKSDAVFVNVIEVDPSRYRELGAILMEGNGKVIRHRDGFISALIAATPDQSRVVTVARWKSADAMKALQSGGPPRSRGRTKACSPSWRSIAPTDVAYVELGRDDPPRPRPPLDEAPEGKPPRKSRRRYHLAAVTAAIPAVPPTTAVDGSWASRSRHS